MEYRKKCEVCGKEFTAYKKTQICCSAECAEERKRRKSLEYQRQKKEKRKIEKIEPNKDRITEMETEARRNGLTYGQYVAKKEISVRVRKAE